MLCLLQVKRGWAGSVRRSSTGATSTIAFVSVLIFAVPERRLSGIRHLDPLLVGRCVCDVVVVPVPPLVRRGLRIAFGRVLPLLLAPERRDIEVAPGAPHRLVTAGIDEVGAEHAVAVAEKHVGAVPLVHAEVSVEAVRDA